MNTLIKVPGITSLVNKSGNRPFLEVNRNNRIKIDYFYNIKNFHVVADVIFGKLCQGPPGHTHGGAISAVLDETMGAAAWLNGYPVMTKTLTVEYLSPLPLHIKIIAESYILTKENNLITIVGKISSQDKKIYAKSSGTFKVISRNHHSGTENFPFDKITKIVEDLKK